MKAFGIDRGKKHIGISLSENKGIPIPLGYLENTAENFFTLIHMILQKKITHIVVGYPSRQKDIQLLIEKFVNELRLSLPEEMNIVFQNEDYTTVQAGALMGDFKKNIANHPIAAVYILEGWLKTLR